MLSLRELQERFADDLLAESEPMPPSYPWQRGAGGTRRLNVYRNNFRESFTDALRAAFPVVHRLVGDAFFAEMARRYVAQIPSTRGDLTGYGHAFPGFLAQQPELNALRYLPDVARLEWALQESYHAASARPLHPGVPPEQVPELRFRLHPSVHLLSSDYPITRIWTVNQDGYDGDGTVSLDEGGAWVMVHRTDEGVGWQTLRRGAWAFLKAISEGRRFERACDAGLAAEPSFGIHRALPALVADGIVVGIQDTAGARNDTNTSTRETT
ncbi:MAG: hypothetical protein GWN84_07785 [Gammaproteobacteria bacterium]|nr:hypothetical protein [Gammaproteobacteria bacterium]NIR82782.1 hypothetical protein [Gammaproteobacteria bacterium]NIR89646.1 hypothetical protein [Gammaproteobacteria bacterium]NIU03942.1 hypothetical protein [Gammaproteobacteria bacterium]NIV51258.1 hypothetical protein [Gammaproteobacteria bacterium]